MKFTETEIKGVYIVEPEPKTDERGYFLRSFCKDEMKKYGIDFDIVQINRALNKEKGTLRGIHYQKNPHWERKIIQCLQGKIYDVVLDLREDSQTFKKWISVEISGENKKMVLVPKGCANGMQTLTDDCLTEYFMGEYYFPEAGTGVRWDDPAFNIKWPIKISSMSEKDKNWEYWNNSGKKNDNC
jgi:dTDP-4-dehydrorhamnose 3,5-epimerase